MFIRNTRLVAVVLAAHVAAGFPANALGKPAPRVDARAIELFQEADTQLSEKNYAHAVILAQRVLQLTDPLLHQDQRGTIVQLIMTASFKAFERDRLDADLCRLDQILADYTTEVLEVFRDIQSRDRTLTAIEEYRGRVRSSVEVECSDPPMSEVSGKQHAENNDTPPVSEQMLDNQQVESHDTPPMPEQLSDQIPTSTSNTQAPQDTRRARFSVIAGGTLIGMSGALLAGAGLTLWQVDVASRANAELLDTLNTESRPPGESELNSANTNYAKTQYRKLALSLGVSAGLMMIIGVPILAVGVHRRKGLRVAPAVSPRHAGLHMRGRF